MCRLKITDLEKSSSFESHKISVFFSKGLDLTTTSQRSVGQKMVTSRSSRPTPTAYQRLSILVDFDSRASHSLPLSLSLTVYLPVPLSLSLSLPLPLSLSRAIILFLPFFLNSSSLYFLNNTLSHALSLSASGSKRYRLLLRCFGAPSEQSNNRTTEQMDKLTTEQTDKRTNGQTDKPRKVRRRQERTKLTLASELSGLETG